MVVIVISGMPGCGSSTVAKLIAKKLGLAHFSPGDYFKEMAKKSGEKNRSESSVKFWLTNKGSSKNLHNYIDKKTESVAKKGNVVIDAKLGITMLKQEADLTVWLKSPQAIRAKRYAKRDKTSVEDSLRTIRKKETLERRNWKRIYGFDYFKQEKKADVVIDNRNSMPEEIIDIILSKLKRVFIVHRWEGSPQADWYPYIKKELEARGYLVNVLSMPDPDAPHVSKWVPFLAGEVGEPNKNTYLIGHSAGVITILRYLEKLKSGRVGGCVFVAGWIDNLGYEELTNFVKEPIKWDAIKKHCRKFIAIHSDNDPFVKMYHGESLKKGLGAGLIIEHRKGHMTGEEGIKKLPSVLDAIEGMAKQ